ncbi:aldehyde dehydrogenase EutE [bacterium]|nr:aldehyde dehydrogenase EutE [bacterium]MBU1071929.1 aldehyde dehydrogenase EutE [bacterium]
MASLSDQQVDRIARRLADRLLGGGAPPAREVASAAAATPSTRDSEMLVDGVHADVDRAVEAAAGAFRRLSAASLDLRMRIVDAVRAAMLDACDELSRLAHEETGLGRYEDKRVKNRLVTLKTEGPAALTPATRTGDRGLTLTEYAPYGVIGAITPTTNPTSTIICNTIGMVSAGNSVVFNVHPSARACSMATIRLINRAVVGAGGPPDLVTAVAVPTIASAQALMKHPGVRLLAVTGGAAVVKAAMQSGKRAICAGPGNPPVVVDGTADLDAAGRDIVRGASFDNNIICVDEKEVFVTEKAAGELIAAMRRHGAYLADASDLRLLERTIFAETRGPGEHAVMNKDLIGKNAGEILARAGIGGGTDPRLVVCEVPAGHPLVWTEQMMPVLPVVRVPDVDAGIDLARRAEHGFGHSAAMHSRDIDALSRMARVMNTSIFVKNGPIFAGLGEGGEGYTSFTIASPTGEGLTGPVAFSRLRRCVLVDHFRIV